MRSLFFLAGCVLCLSLLTMPVFGQTNADLANLQQIIAEQQKQRVGWADEGGQTITVPSAAAGDLAGPRKLGPTYVLRYGILTNPTP